MRCGKVAMEPYTFVSYSGLTRHGEFFRVSGLKLVVRFCSLHFSGKALTKGGGAI